MGEHRQEFQRELEAIEAKIIELFAMVAEDLPAATQALLSGNSEAAEELAERDQVIDALYTETDELVSREILLQAPVASDLRFLLSVLRIVPEIERSHDLVVEIARQADHLLSGDLSPRSRGLVERMGDLAAKSRRSEQARTYFAEALALARQLDPASVATQHLISTALDRLGNLAAETGDRVGERRRRKPELAGKRRGRHGLHHGDRAQKAEVLRRQAERAELPTQQGPGGPRLPRA